MSIFESFVKGQMDAQEMLNANFAVVEAQLANKANKEAPAEHELPLSSGLQAFYMCCYSRNQVGMVNINIGIVTIDDSPLEAGTILAILPEGFRPSKRCVFAASLETSPGRIAGVIIIDPNGEIAAGYDNRSVTPISIYGSGSFVAASPDYLAI